MTIPAIVCIAPANRTSAIIKEARENSGPNWSRDVKNSPATNLNTTYFERAISYKVDFSDHTIKRIVF